MRIVEETLGGESLSSVARRNGVAPNLLYRWRRLMLEGGTIAVQSDDSVTANRTVRQCEARARELERQLGRKTLEVEILKGEAEMENDPVNHFPAERWTSHGQKNRPCLCARRDRTVRHERGGDCVGRVAFEPA